MHLNISLRTSACRTGLENYIDPIRIDVVCDEEDDAVGGGHVVAKLFMDRVRISDVWIDGRESLYDVCDADSGGMLDMYQALFTRRGKLRRWLRDLKEDIQFSYHILFLYGATIHPSVERWRRAIYTAAFGAFDDTHNLEVLWREVGGLTRDEADDLGFVPSPGDGGLLVRHSCHTSPYSRRHPRGEDTDAVTATAECERWLLAHTFPA